MHFFKLNLVFKKINIKVRKVNLKIIEVNQNIKTIKRSNIHNLILPLVKIEKYY